MYHMHIGLSTWSATEIALAQVSAGLAAHGCNGRSVRAGSGSSDGCLSKPSAISPSKRPDHESDPTSGGGLGEAAPIQPHLGDHMIGFPAGFQNTLQALAAGVTTIGNVGQYTAYDLLGGSDEILVTEETVRSLAAIGALRAARGAGPFEPRGRLSDPGVAFRCVRRVGSTGAVRRRGTDRCAVGALLRQHDPTARRTELSCISRSTTSVTGTRSDR